MGCIITINIIEGKNPVEGADIKIKTGQNIIDLYKIENQKVTNNIINDFKTDKDGRFQAYIFQNKDLTIEAEYNGKIEIKKIEKSELSQGLLSTVFNFEESVDNEKNLIVKGQFVEYPINKPIIKMQGEIALKFKINNNDYEARISSILSKEKFSGGNTIPLTNGKNLDWFGEFNQGIFWFGLDVPKGVDIKDFKIEANYPNQTYISPYTFNKEFIELHSLTIPYNHPARDYRFNAQLQRFNAVPNFNNGVITSFYPVYLEFNHRYKTLSGESKMFIHKIEISTLPINHPNDALVSIAGEDSLKLEYSFNNGFYTFTLKDIIGEITNAELSINYGGWKTHKGKANGWPTNRFNFSENHTEIDLNNTSRDIIIPLNGWQGDFEIIPNRRNEPIIDIHFEGINIRGMEITINDPNKRAFDKLDFKINNNTLKYNDSGAESLMGFVLNMYICDSNFDPIMIKLLGAQAQTKIAQNIIQASFIHSIDFYPGNSNTNSIFPPFKIDPLNVILNLSLNEIIMLPKKRDERIIVPQLEFIKEDNSLYDLGTYYVLVEVVPVHYIKNGNNATIDSIGCPKRTVYKIIFG